MRTIIHDAKVLTLDPRGTEFERASVIVDGNCITDVTTAALPCSEAADLRHIDGRGHLLMPGLVNGHFHSSVNDAKGSLDSLPLEVFMLFESPSDAGVTEPRSIYVRSCLAAMEMLRSGVTTVLDDAFFVPVPTPESIDAVMQAYSDCGIRVALALDQPNVPELDKFPFLAEILPPALRDRAAAAPPMDTAGLLACYRHLITRWHGKADGRLRAAVSCSAPQRVTTDYFGALDDLSREHDLPFYIHVLETKLQRVLGEEKFAGRSLIRYVHDEGFLTERLNIIHGIWVDNADLDLIAAAGSVIAHNPISNLRLGSGIMPWRRMRERQIPICLGTDEAIADDAVNMWNVAKLAGLIHNISTPDYESWPRAPEVLDCLIGGGARAMRSPQPIGQIARGYQADLILLDLDTLAFTPLNDLQRQLVYCESGSSVRLTMVAGEIVFEQGKLSRLDEAGLRAEARELAERRKPQNAAALRASQEWAPYYRQMYLRAAARDVGFSRWASGEFVHPGGTP